MSGLAAVQSLIVMLLWLYIGRVMLSRWLDDPTSPDMEEIAEGVFRQKPRHRYGQIVATLGYWMAAACCFWLAIGHLLPEKPDSAAQGDQPENHARDTRDSGTARMASQDPTGNHPLPVLVVDPLADPHRAGTHAQPDQRLPERGIVADSDYSDQDRSSNERQRAVPLVGPECFSYVHAASRSVLEGNALRERQRP